MFAHTHTHTISGLLTHPSFALIWLAELLLDLFNKHKGFILPEVWMDFDLHTGFHHLWKRFGGTTQLGLKGQKMGVCKNQCMDHRMNPECTAGASM